MKKTFIALFYLIPTLVAAQSDDFKLFPLQGKISNYEIVKISGDSLNEKEIPIEQVTFDKDGHVLDAKYYSSYSNSIRRQEKSTVAGHIITTYECECADLSQFINTFAIRSKEELKHKKGGATNNPPTEYCTIKTLDKKGNVVLAKRYSVHGYQVSEIKSSYDAKGNLLSKVVYDFYDSISYTEKNTYDKKGNLTERVSKRMEAPFETKELFEYTDQDNLKKELTYQNEVLKNDFDYLETHIENKRELFKTDKLKDSKYIMKEILYNHENMEIKQTAFSSNGSIQKIIETEYYENGKIKTRLFYNAENNLTRKILFANDKKNNWQEWITYNLVTTVLKDAKTTAWKQTTYKLHIAYLK